MIGALSPKELAQHVSDYLGTVSHGQHNQNEYVFFQKKIVLKEESAINLKDRLAVLLKYEDAQRVVVGVFSQGGGISHDEVCKIFKQVCIGLLRQEVNVRSGRVMCVEVNGTGKGCGIIAADDKI